MLSSIMDRSRTTRRIAAVALPAAMMATALLAGIARIAETPASGSTGKLGVIAPGALGQIRFELAKIGMGRPEVEPSIARHALAGVPLSSDPFTALAASSLLADPRGTGQRERALLAEALRRDPRSRAGRILLLRQMAATGDLVGAFNQLSVLNRLNPGLIEQIMEAITVRIGSPRQVDDALAALAGHDALYQPFVNRMIGKNKPRAVVVRLAERLPAKVLERPDIRRSVVRLLVDAQAYGPARTIWQGGNRGSTAGLLHAPDFADQAAPPPFNWQLLVGPTGAAERGKAGGLTIAYYDRNPGPLATQLVTLAPGAYRATIDFEVIDGTADNVRLRVSCRDSADILAEVPLVRRKAGADRLTLPFSVPQATCAAQVLGIFGVASERRGQTQLVIRRIDLDSGARP